MGPLDWLGRLFGVDDRRWSLTVPMSLKSAQTKLASSRTLSDETTVQQLDQDSFLVRNREWTDVGRLATFDRFWIHLNELPDAQTRVDVRQRMATANRVFFTLLFAGVYAFGGWGIATAIGGTWQALIVLALPVGWWLIAAMGRETAHSDCRHFLWAYLAVTDAPPVSQTPVAAQSDALTVATAQVACDGLDSHRMQTPRTSRLIVMGITVASLTVLALAPLPVQAAVVVGGVALGFAVLSVLSYRCLFVTADHLTCTFLHHRWDLPLRDVTRVGIKTIGANTWVMLYPKTGTPRDIPLAGLRRDPMAVSHLMRWLNRPDVDWEPGSHEALNGRTPVTLPTA